MPYLTKDVKETLKKNVFAATNPGSLNYLFTLVLLQAFKANPKYETIHVLYRDFVQDPKHNELIKKLRNDFADRFTVADLYTGARLAWAEFNHRIVRKYEDKKIQLNGDVEEYADVEKLIEELK